MRDPFIAAPHCCCVGCGSSLQTTTHRRPRLESNIMDYCWCWSGGVCWQRDGCWVEDGGGMAFPLPSPVTPQRQSPTYAHCLLGGRGCTLDTSLFDCPLDYFRKCETHSRV